MIRTYVVVVTQGESVLGVIGPRDSELEAQAVADVIRHENGIETHVRAVREIHAFDVHGAALADELGKLT